MNNHPETNRTHQPLYYPEIAEQQLTARAVFMGGLLGGLVTIINVYLGLQTGWSMGGSLIAAMLGYAAFALFPGKSPYTVLENNITQTVGSAASAIAIGSGLISAIPALKWTGYTFTSTHLYLWCLSVSFLGVFFAVPLRKQMIVVEQLRFPSGTATATSILALHENKSADNDKARYLIGFAIFAGTYTLASYFIPFLKMPALFEFIGLSVLVSSGFQLLVSPMLIGAGLILGPRVGLSLLLGAIISWGVIAPTAVASGWVQHAVLMDYQHGIAGWLLWPGVAMMLGESLTSLVLSIGKMVWGREKKNTPAPFETGDLSLKGKGESIDTPHSDHIPFSWWLSGFLLSALLCMSGLHYFFDISWTLGFIGIGISWILSIIASRASGITDINPISAIAKITQLIFGVLAPGNYVTNLMSAAASGAGAASASDMLGDLKTGYLLQASVRAQFIAQLFGILAGILFVVPVYLLFDRAYQIGGVDMPAPSAHAWQAMSLLLSGGWANLPMHIFPALLAGLLVGTALPLLHEIKKIGPYIPSALAMGIAFIVPPMYSMTLCAGSLILWFWQRRNPIAAERLNYAIASGLILGEGLMGLVVAVLIIIGVPRLISV